jgi:hypothetical protein
VETVAKYKKSVARVAHRATSIADIPRYTLEWRCPVVI